MSHKLKSESNLTNSTMTICSTGKPVESTCLLAGTPGNPEIAWLRRTDGPASGRTEFSMLGHLVLRIDHESHDCAWYWRDADTGNLRRMCHQPDLLEPLRDETVLALLGERLLMASGKHDRLRMPTLPACVAAMGTYMCAAPELRNWESDWRMALSSHRPGTLDLAQKARLKTEEGLSLALYSLVCRYEPLFRDVHDNSPTLTPLLAIAAAAGLPLLTDQNTLRYLKDLLCAQPGCGPATWRWLVRWGVDPIMPFIEALAPDRSADRVWRLTIQFLELWTRARLPPPMPGKLSTSWASQLTPTTSLKDFCADRIEIIARHAAALSTQELMDQESALAALLNHSSTALPMPDRNQRRSGMPWLQKEHQRAIRSGLDPDTLASIRNLIPDEIEAANVTFILLRNERMILDEGRAMRHCMESDPYRHHNDGLLHFSVCCRHSGNRLATCSLNLATNKAEIVDMRSSRNRKVPKKTRERIKKLLNMPEIKEALPCFAKNLETQQTSALALTCPHHIHHGLSS